MAEDIREALAQAAAEAPLPGHRVGAWIAAVPVYAAHARREESRPPVDAARALFPPRRLAHRRGAARGTLAAAAVAVFSLSLVVAGIQVGIQPGGRSRAASIATASSQRGARPPIAGVFYDGCPPGESLVVSLQSGYTFCRPSAWQIHDYGFSAGSLGDYESVTGLVDPTPPPTPDRRTAEVPAADILVSVSFETLATATSAGHLTGGKAITVGGLHAMDYVLGDSDPLAAERVVLVQRGDRLYRIEQVRATTSDGLAFQEVLRTFLMQGLPYSADEQLRIAQSKTG